MPYPTCFVFHFEMDSYVNLKLLLLTFLLVSFLFWEQASLTLNLDKFSCLTVVSLTILYLSFCLLGTLSRKAC